MKYNKIALTLSLGLILSASSAFGMKRSITDRDFNQQFIEAAKTGNTTLVHDILTNHPVNINAQEYLFGDTALNWAAYKGHTEMVKILLEANADIHAQDKHYTTPLHDAAQSGHTEIVKILLDAGANINAQTRVAILLFI